MLQSSDTIRSALAWIKLIAGLFCWALAVVLMLKSDLGLGPWDLFHQGVSLKTGISIGYVVIGVGVLILGATLALGQRPGLGTLANMLLIGSFMNLLIPILPVPGTDLLRYLSLAAGIVLVGLGSGLYIGAQLGAGPRDSLMLALSQRSGWSVRRVRTMIELIVLTLGWLLGGTIGIGTVAFALLIGPSVQLGLRLCRALPQQRTARPGGFDREGIKIA